MVVSVYFSLKMSLFDFIKIITYIIAYSRPTDNLTGTKRQQSGQMGQNIKN